MNTPKNSEKKFWYRARTLLHHKWAPGSLGVGYVAISLVLDRIPESKEFEPDALLSNASMDFFSATAPDIVDFRYKNSGGYVHATREFYYSSNSIIIISKCNLLAEEIVHKFRT